ncbi:hypothetical protein EYF80_043253 [Liparis tanakae]|uniref:Uncharacterized protein n=1 Tax=Liparis tanakae TaxID=230148 RepID=A0A4Z2FZW0_9TELE|nr:hypothetical protein EYF80_043253 [Liparis tanakae]
MVIFPQRVRDTCPSSSRLGSSPAGGEKENLWRREVKKRNNSMRASGSPRHTRLPENNNNNNNNTR